MTWALLLGFLRSIGGWLVDVFHALLPPDRLATLAKAAVVAVIGWLACYVHYDVHGLTDDRAAYVKLQQDYQALDDSRAAALRVAAKKGEDARDLAFRAGFDAGVSFQKTAGALTPLISKVPVYVTQESDAACAVPWGFVRLWDAFATGADIDSVRARVGAGQPDDARSDVTLSEIAALFGTTAIRAHQNADQLNRLIEFDKNAAAIAAAPAQ